MSRNTLSKLARALKGLTTLVVIVVLIAAASPVSAAHHAGQLQG